ncbi:MAG: RsmB/NOP family class I SAM-dependent RNA methyltransferase [Alphaproteobacteria bacterium]|nr:RsmB/NOP family class I SAM-dependent RNA methyltransferase [Alphaproteobacteria bacterium]
MQAPAQIQAAIDACQLIFDQRNIPADKLLNTYFRERRYIGSKDKRAIASHVYTALRLLPRYIRVTGDDARLLLLKILRDEQNLSVADLREIFSGDAYSPQKLTKFEMCRLEEEEEFTDAEKRAIPDELYPFFIDSMSPETCEALAAAYLTEGTFDLRVNTLKSTREAVLALLTADGYEVSPTPLSPIGIRFNKRQSLEGHPLFKEGMIEVQDEGSQLIALSCEAASKMTVLDYCAGAGGKTLALAAAMQNKGQLFACDIHEWRLKRARERIKRADIHNVRCQQADDSKFLKRHSKFFDRVLVDAPCSGTGTWRRNPDMKFKTTATDITELQALQRTILTKAAPMVRPGGWLIYATCSVLKAENHDQIAWFLENYPGFTAAATDIAKEASTPTFYADLRTKLSRNEASNLDDTLGLQLLPHTHGTDGFFISILIRNNEEEKENISET